MSSLESFAAIAEDFCAWVEAEPSDPRQELELARRLAARLYAAALELPAGNPDPARRFDDPTIARATVFKRFAALPINMYSVVEPLEVPASDSVVADLADDFSDTYFDVLRGLRLYRSGLHQAAAEEWSFYFRAHWGDHVVSALSALHAYASKE